MAATPRPKGKPTEIAYKILGKPATMDQKDSKEKKIDKRLVFEETVRAR